jgi:hypothetical protein
VGLAKGRLSASTKHLCKIQLQEFRAKNPPHCQAENREQSLSKNKMFYFRKIVTLQYLWLRIFIIPMFEQPWKRMAGLLPMIYNKMDKIANYKSIVKSAIKQYERDDHPEGYEEFETQVVTDDINGHYYLMDVGWHSMQRIHGCILHLDIKQDKIWIQQDWTDSGIADDLMAAGVPKEDIVRIQVLQ